MFMNMGGGGSGFPKQQQRRHTAPANSPSSIPVNTPVTLKGLSASSKNGLRGRISGHVGSRHVVLLDGTGERISVKPRNLQQHPRVTVEGTRAEDLNGKRADVVGYDEAQVRRGSISNEERSAAMLNVSCVL